MCVKESAMPAPVENSDYALQLRTKAVAFTHLKVDPQDISREASQDTIDKYVPFFKGYLKCQNVGLVYIYFSSGVERVIRNVAEGKDLVIPPKVLDDEAICLDILQLAETQARETYPGKSLKFIYVATFQLASLLRNLFEIDHALLNFLHGHGVFTYDSPKFVEAVIRLARAQRPQLAFYPVVRFDEDVEISERSLSILLAEYERLLLQSPNLYFFFSGSYGDPDQPDDLAHIDFINDRAVRTHWFSHASDNGYVPDCEKIRLFWRDLGEVGATQLGRNDDPSHAGTGLTIERKLIANRDARQVISGAGLIMSIKAIQDLPPFMNVNRLIVWIDDHLKRQLHEAVGHINSKEKESVTEARFKQDRHPNGIGLQDIDWAAEKYFDALLAGCLMDSIISQPCKVGNNVVRASTEFARAVEDIINKDEGGNYQSLKPQLVEYAERRYDEVLLLWQTQEFKDTVLYSWAKTRDAAHRNTQVTEVVDDALAYLDLVKRWKGPFAAAIGQLRPIGNHWLFELVPS
jgi:hypothetical protein